MARKFGMHGIFRGLNFDPGILGGGGGVFFYPVGFFWFFFFYLFDHPYLLKSVVSPPRTPSWLVSSIGRVLHPL